MALWCPQPGPQAAAWNCPAKKIFFGGARSGGKSDLLIGSQMRGIETHGNKWNGLLVRRKYKDLREIRRRIDEFIGMGMPAARIGGETQTNYVRFSNGGLIQLAAIERIEQADDFLSQQFTEIGIDEAGSIPFIGGLVDKLSGSLRSPHGVPTRIILCGNPGGPGHGWLKRTFIDGHQVGEHFPDEGGNMCVFIQSFLEDNEILVTADPTYAATLRGISDKALRAAWLDGDWDSFIGQAFPFDPDWHIIRNPPPIPETGKLLMTIDFGFMHPFSIGWWWWDDDRRLYRFAEWYGCTGKPNEGLRLADSEIAAGILRREETMGIRGREIVRLAGGDAFQKRPDYHGGGQGPGPSETFAQFGLFLQPGDTDRRMKLRQFRERMLIRRDADGKVIEPPMLRVYPTCTDFIRTIPELSMDTDNPEDLDMYQECHAFDDSCHACMWPPLARGLVLSDDLLQQVNKTASGGAMDRMARKGAVFA